MSFEPLDAERFPAFSAICEAGRLGGGAPAAVNAADEVLVERFLAEEIPFLAIAEGLERILARWRERSEGHPEDLAGRLAADRWAREAARDLRFAR